MQEVAWESSGSLSLLMPGPASPRDGSGRTAGEVTTRWSWVQGRTAPGCTARAAVAPDTGVMEISAAVAIPLLAWLSSGLAAVALTPRHLTARALLLAGVLLAGSWLAEGAAARAPGATVTGAVLRVITDVLFLGGLAAIVAFWPATRRGSSPSGGTVPSSWSSGASASSARRPSSSAPSAS